MADFTVSTDIDTLLQSADNAAARASLGLGGSEPTIAVADASAMQVIIDAGSVEVGQLFKLATDKSIRRFEGGTSSVIISNTVVLVADNTAKLALGVVEAAQQVRITGEGNRLEQYKGENSNPNYEDIYYTGQTQPYVKQGTLYNGRANWVGNGGLDSIRWSGTAWEHTQFGSPDATSPAGDVANPSIGWSNVDTFQEKFPNEDWLVLENSVELLVESTTYWVLLDGATITGPGFGTANAGWWKEGEMIPLEFTSSPSLYALAVTDVNGTATAGSSSLVTSIDGIGYAVHNLPPRALVTLSGA